jgi:iron complex outermembrane receptor protein
MKNLRHGLLLSSLLASHFTYADDDIDLIDFSLDLPVISSASRLNQSLLNSPSSVTVIDSDMIAASGFTEIADLMRLVPGFIVANVVHGAHAVISHGEGWEYPNRMQLLIDGRSTYTSALSGIAWNALGIHIEDIDRIEVVRGPAASAFGSNSYAGAINIMTKAPELDDAFSIRARYGNHNEKEWLLRHSNTLDKLSYRISLSKRENDGIVDYRDSKSMRNGSGSARLKLNKHNELFAAASFNNGTIQRANFTENVDNDFFDSERDVNAWSVNLRWDHYISDTKEFKATFFHNYFDENDMALSYPLSEVLGISPAAFQGLTGEADQQITIGERTYHTHRSDVEVQYSHIFNSGLQYVVGAGLRYDTMKSEAFFPNDGTKSNVGKRFFANVQIPVTDFVDINLGSLYELNNTERPHLSPRGSLNFHLNPRQTIRLGYSEAYRIPSLLEEHVDTGLFLHGGTVLDQIYVSNDKIKAEHVKSIDISYLGQLQAAPITWEFRAYREEYQDSIFFYDDHDDSDLIDNELTRIGNAANSTMYGFEGEVMFRPEKSSFIRFHFNVGHISGGLLTDVNREPPDTATQILSLDDYSPETSFGVLASKKINSWQANIAFYHMDNIKWGSAGGKVDRYDRIDASVVKNIKLSSNETVEIKIAGQNLNKHTIFEFNKTDQFPLMFEPRYYASIALRHF